MEILRWLLTAVLAAGFLGLGVFNWRSFLIHAVKEKRAPAPVPLVAGVVGIVALYMCPLEGSSDLWWTPLVIDFGSLPYALWLAWTSAVRRPSSM